MNINEIKYGFKLLEVVELNDLNAKLYHYEHLKSGGNVYHVENDDTKGFLDAILSVKAIGKDKLSENCVDRVKQYFDRDKNYMEYII